MTSTEVKYNNRIDPLHRKKSSRQLFSQQRRCLWQNKFIVNIVFIDIAITQDTNQHWHRKRFSNSLAPPPWSMVGACVTDKGGRLFSIHNANIKVEYNNNMADWEFRDQQEFKEWQHHQQRNIFRDWRYRQQKESQWLHQAEWVHHRKKENNNKEFNNLATMFFARWRWTTRTGSTTHLDNKRRVNNKNFNSRGTSEEVKYNKRIDPYIGGGQVQQVHHKCIKWAHR